MQSLYVGFIGIIWNSKDWLGTIYASFGVQGINNFGWIIGFSKKQFICSTSALICIKKSIEP
jgi:uncharacterized membrane protein (DUF485 family)